MGELDDGLDRHQGAGDVGELGDRDEPGARRQQRLERGEIEPAGRIDRRDHQAEAEPVAQQLPRHDVGVMLEVADHDLVAGFEKGRAPALRDEVDRLGGAAHEDDLARVGGVEKARTFSRAASNRSVERALSW